MRRPTPDGLTSTGFGLIYASLMATGLLSSSRFPRLAELAIPYLLLPAAGVGLLLMIWARVLFQLDHRD